MKIYKTKYSRDPDGTRHSEEVELDITDAAGVVLKEGQKVWYARASKSAPSQLFQAKITKLTISSVTLEYSDDSRWWYEGCPDSASARLTSAQSRFNEGIYSYRQLAVISE